MLSMRGRVDLRVRECKPPAVSLHENRGSDGEVGVMRDKLSSTQIGHKWPFWVGSGTRLGLSGLCRREPETCAWAVVKIFADYAVTAFEATHSIECSS